ncbi:MAG: hypothetical protein JWN48_2614, partial [Myxococcaceae bacterium]|nr:hypothetical protein [Myxococcaceae bacterium]
ARLRSELDRSYREPSPRAAARREAVDLLLSGRTRAALDAYRAHLSALGPEAQNGALAVVVRVLEREERERREQATAERGTTCGP